MTVWAWVGFETVVLTGGEVAVSGRPSTRFARWAPQHRAPARPKDFAMPLPVGQR